MMKYIITSGSLSQSRLLVYYGGLGGKLIHVQAIEREN